MKSRLLEELKIGSMTVKNAVFMAPMSLGYESPDGTVNETMQEYWLARARGGVGCIITDALSVDPDVPYLGNTLCFRNEESIASYRRFTDRIHEYGTKIIPQITHPGSVSAFRGIPPVASSVYLNSMAQRTRAVTLEEIPGIIQKYAKGAYDARRAGFDGIELHCAHAYMLLGSFLSPMRNKRTDRYGGSLDNRARLLCEVLDAIREACGPDFPVILRMSGSERDEQGNTLEDMKYLVPVLERHGVAAFEISGGTQYERCNKIIPCHGEVQGVNVPEAEALHEAASVPVIVVGKINEPRFAGYLVDSGKVDGVVLGRALIADPDFVNKMEAGDYEGIAPCAACAIGCVGEQTKRHPASCVINPAAGREKELELTAAEQPKRVVIVGGGIGGMACARAFAVRGHEVVLLEREMELGGQMRLACIPPHKQELSKWIVYLEHELERLSVDVRLNTAADRAVIDGLAPEVLILATGAKEMLPPVPGIDPEQAVTAWQVLSGETVIPGGNVLVVGGGMVGCEICEYLMHQKRGSLHITMIEMADEIGAGMVVNNRVPTMIRLNRPEITMMTGTKLMSVNGSDVTVERHGVQETFGGFTHVIYACGARPARALFDELKEAYPEAVLIGDASQPAQALEAVRQAVETAVRLG